MFFFLLQSINAFQTTFQSSASSNWTLKLELDKPATKVQVTKQLFETLPKKNSGPEAEQLSVFAKLTTNYRKLLKTLLPVIWKETDPKLSNTTKIINPIVNTNANINKFRAGISKCKSYINQFC